MRKDILLGAAGLAQLARSQSSSNNGDGDERIDECFPDDPTAPCVAIANIESICMQRGISTEDHQRCMCDGSYFQDWAGCQQCLRVNGALGEVEVDYWSGVMSDASTALCDSDSEPTTWLRDYFSEAAATGAPLTVDGSAISKATLVSETDVSLYFTATESQGPGITPTVAPQSETETTSTTEGTTGTGTETETQTGTETETETGDGQDNGDEDDAAGSLYVHGASGVAAIMAVAALFVVM
ncbi:hypothetical protein CC79DRAFT_1325575 [Sarocladium strictum]